MVESVKLTNETNPSKPICRDDAQAVLLNELPITMIQGSFFVNLGNMCLLFYGGQKHPDKSALEQGTI